MTLLFREDAYRRSCPARVIAADAAGVRLDQTVFYPTGGGQPGDTGWLRAADGTAWRVVDTVKGAAPDAVVHVLEPGPAPPAPGLPVEAVLDWDRRYRHMRMHSAMHLVCAVVTGDVTGGQVGETRSRLDFNLPSGALDRERIGAALNELVGAALPVRSLWIDEDELARRPDLVRTLSVKPPSGAGRVRLLAIGPEDRLVDLQPCGGTHIANTQEIGALAVGKIENKGKQNRRINIELVAP